MNSNKNKIHKDIIISPKSNDLNKPETIRNHVEGLKKKKICITNSEILDKLLGEFRLLDFRKLAFQELKKIENLEEDLKSNELTKEDRIKKQDELKSLAQRIKKKKLSLKHYLVLTIENIQKYAANRDWDLCKNNDTIFLYNGMFWVEVDNEEVQTFLGKAAERMGVEKYDARYYKFRENLFKQFLSSSFLPIPQNIKNKVLINLSNGTFEIGPNITKIRPFEKSDFLTYQLPFDFDTKAKAPLFEKYLNRVLPDKNSQRVLAEFLGYIFIKNGGDLKLEKALVLLGGGQNGKSVFYEIVNALLGPENICNYSLQSITDVKGYYRAKLANKLLNYASEINGKLETSTFKQMVSGEPVEARPIYGQPFNLKQYSKFIFNCNELPKEVEHTKAYFRRFLIIPFEVQISEEEKDPDLAVKIIEKELSGVFNWVLMGLNRLLEERKFTHCKASIKALKRYETESDSVKLFLDDKNYKISLTEEEPLKNLFSGYKDFCIEGHFKTCSLKTFAERLRNAGFHTHRKNYGMIVYIDINPSI